MLRNSLDHVLCRARRDVIRKRAPLFHRWRRPSWPMSAARLAKFNAWLVRPLAASAD